jgi:hypothetical protein
MIRFNNKVGVVRPVRLEPVARGSALRMGSQPVLFVLPTNTPRKVLVVIFIVDWGFEASIHPWLQLRRA